MNKPIRTISIFCMFLFVALMVNATYLQYYKAADLNKDPRNGRTKVAAFSRDRGAILVGRTPIADSEKSDDKYEYQRQYSQPFKYAHITGFYYFDNAQGTCSTCQQGIEQTQNDVLNGDDPSLFVTKLVDLLSNNNSQGGSVQLTIDGAAQDAAFDGLSKLGPNVEASAVAIEPSTGKILAMASLPSFDPNKLALHDTGDVAQNYADLTKVDSEPLLDRAIQKTLPPGSTFKLVTAAAALESDNYDGDSLVPGGSTYTPPQTSNVIDNEGRNCGTDKIPFSQALEQSCNTTFARLAVELGPQKMQEQAEAFGFNLTYFDDLKPQAKSVYPDGVTTEADGKSETRDLSDAETAQTGIGQFEVRSTPLQMAMVVAGIANDGLVMKPYLVDEVQSAEYDVLDKKDTEEFRANAISQNTADALTDMMVNTVNVGTATAASIPGVNVAGKTGTAQSGTDASPYAWFVSFAPAEDPKVAVAVMIESAGNIPRGEIGGGSLGGPIAKAIMEAVINND